MSKIHFKHTELKYYSPGAQLSILEKYPKVHYLFEGMYLSTSKLSPFFLVGVCPFFDRPLFQGITDYYLYADSIDVSALHGLI